VSVSDGYLVPSATVRVETVVVNSRFITLAGRVETVEAAKAFVAAVRMEFPDANHHVYAFRVGHGASVIDGVSDDGEPSGTSGPPVLAVLRGSDIGDIAIVVTRYFGGTKLGTGGLTRAYSEAARTVLAELPLERKIVWSKVAADMPYSLYELVNRLLPTYEAVVEDQEFGALVTLYFRVPTARAYALSAAIVELSSGTVVPVLID
jgi:uncharacterized YigZ family protein